VCTGGGWLAGVGADERLIGWESALIMLDRGLGFNSIVILVIFCCEGSLVCSQRRAFFVGRAVGTGCIV